MSTKHIGDQGEAIAAAYLEAQGYTILERNYRFEHAEVDLVCFKPAAQYEQGGELIFTEVKTRTGLGFGRPEEAVTEEKKRHLIRAAKAYLYERKLEGSPCRFDVISIVLQGGQEPEIEHFEDAFWVL
ncbi:MAG TPA: YraN family protein [Rhodothermales bacterium]|nr:YraN family protein [Rhodothermales bacterium]